MVIIIKISSVKAGKNHLALMEKRIEGINRQERTWSRSK